MVNKVAKLNSMWNLWTHFKYNIIFVPRYAHFYTQTHNNKYKKQREILHDGVPTVIALRPNYTEYQSGIVNESCAFIVQVETKMVHRYA